MKKYNIFEYTYFEGLEGWLGLNEKKGAAGGNDYGYRCPS